MSIIFIDQAYYSRKTSLKESVSRDEYAKNINHHQQRYGLWFFFRRVHMNFLHIFAFFRVCLSDNSTIIIEDYSNNIRVFLKKKQKKKQNTNGNKFNSAFGSYLCDVNRNCIIILMVVVVVLNNIFLQCDCVKRNIDFKSF